MKNSYILSLDQGTTGSTVLIIDKNNLKIIDKEKTDYPQIYPNPGLVEHNLHDILNSIKTSTDTILKRQSIDPKDINCIAITNQRETTCAFSKKGTPLHHAIVWQDRRTFNWCQEHKEKYTPLRKKTGLPLDPYFSATKMNWLLKNSESVKKAYQNDDLLFGTIDTFLIYSLTNGESFVTEPSNASRTLLLDLNTFKWDQELLDFFGIKQKLLPSIQDSFSHFGKTKNCSFLPDGIPILSVLGDQQAALFGQACFEEGDMKCTYGTGAFLLLNTGNKLVYSPSGLLSTAYFQHKGVKHYALEGSSYIAGAAVQWMRDNLKAVDKSSEIEVLARTITNDKEMEFILFYPFFSGLGTPYWDSEIKASIMGLTRDSNLAHISRACLEGIALSVELSVGAFRKDFGKIKSFRVDGGASENDLLMQFQANFSNLDIIKPEIIDTTAFGVAMGCLVSLGEKSLDDLSKLWKINKKIKPEISNYFISKKDRWIQYLESRLLG